MSTDPTQGPTSCLRHTSLHPQITPDAELVPARILALAQAVIVEHGLDSPLPKRLQLLVREAMEAQAHFHTASMEEPTTLHLDGFLMQFILNAVSNASLRC